VNQGDLDEIGIILNYREEVDFLVVRVDKLGFLLAEDASPSFVACGHWWLRSVPSGSCGLAGRIQEETISTGRVLVVTACSSFVQIVSHLTTS
jgi:hypothetical protein